MVRPAPCQELAQVGGVEGEGILEVVSKPPSAQRGDWARGEALKLLLYSSGYPPQAFGKAAGLSRGWKGRQLHQNTEPLGF